MVIIILSVILLIIAVALVGAVRFKFRFDKKQKTISISYLLFGFLIDFDTMTGQFSVAAIRVKRIELKSLLQKTAKETPGTATLPPAKKAEKMPRWLKLGWSDIKRFFRLLGKIRTKDLVFTISGGISDPYQTGKYFGYYMALCGVFPRLMSHISFQPDFAAESLKFEGKGIIYIRVYQILIFAIKMIFEKLKKLINLKYVTRKKGASYA
ncbi:MAG: hypothetical protein NT002_09855 [candidate division Zixibacteria bacterium]|nr:hypothetical protein [candidate division Zixibacteria bacterium]